MRIALVLYGATHQELRQLRKQIGNSELRYIRRGEFMNDTVGVMRICDEKQHTVDEASIILESCLSIWVPGWIDTTGMETGDGGDND